MDGKNINETVINNNPVKDKKGFSIAALLLGIMAILLSCLCFISVPCGIVAIILGVLGIKSSKRGMSIAGITTGGIGIVISIILLIVFIFGFFGFVKDIIRYGIDSIEDYENSSYYDRSTYDYDYYDYYDDLYKID